MKKNIFPSVLETLSLQIRKLKNTFCNFTKLEKVENKLIMYLEVIDDEKYFPSRY